MTYQRFEDLPVWQDAAKLYERVEILLELSEFSVTRGFRDQLDRASLSVSNNIAEGFERGTTKELLAFLYIARGSAGEVRSMLAVKSRRIPEGNLKFPISNPWPNPAPARFALGPIICKTRTSKVRVI